MLFVFHTKNSTAWGTAPWSSQGGPGLCVRICPLPQLHPAAAGTSETCAFSLKPSGSCQPQTQMLLLSSAVCSWRTKGRFSKAVMRIRSWNPIDLWWRLGVGALVAHQKLLSFFLVVRVAGPRMSLCCLLCSSGNRSCLETFVFGISHLVLKQRGSKDPKFRLGSLGPCCHCEVMWGERISSCYFEAAVSASICFVSWIVWGVERCIWWRHNPCFIHLFLYFWKMHYGWSWRQSAFKEVYLAYSCYIRVYNLYFLYSCPPFYSWLCSIIR